MTADSNKTQADQRTIEIQDHYDQLRRMYSSDPVTFLITEAQLTLIQRLVRDAYLFRSDFPAGTYYRKRKLTRRQASDLIKRGLSNRYG